MTMADNYDGTANQSPIHPISAKDTYLGPGAQLPADTGSKSCPPTNALL